MKLKLLTLLLLAPFGCAEARAEDGVWLRSAVAKAKHGAVVDIPAGDYDVTDLKITRNLTLRGPAEGGAVLYSAEVTEKGLLVPLAGVNLTVENLTFRDANSWDRNGAGIRHEGVNLTVVNCIFDDNEDGILATGDPAGLITISKSKFVDNGFGDGQSHAIYVFAARKLEVTDSEFVGTRIGHHVKSLADETIVMNSTLDDANGRSSYAVDASKGGKLTVVGNRIVQSANADNHTIINYDLTRGGEAREVVIRDNRIVNRVNGGLLLRNDTKSAPVVEDNEIVNEGARPLKMQGR